MRSLSGCDPEVFQLGLVAWPSKRDTPVCKHRAGGSPCLDTSTVLPPPAFFQNRTESETCSWPVLWEPKQPFRRLQCCVRDLCKGEELTVPLLLPREISRNCWVDILGACLSDRLQGRGLVVSHNILCRRSSGFETREESLSDRKRPSTAFSNTKVEEKENASRKRPTGGDIAPKQKMIF